MKEARFLSIGKLQDASLRSGIWALTLLVLGIAGFAAAQTITPDDAKDQARFEAVSRAVARSGYGTPAVVGLSRGAETGLFALLTTHAGKGVLIVATEPDAKGLTNLVELETDKVPADIGVAGVRFEPFLGERDLLDVVIGHRPFQLEMSRLFDIHHIMRRAGGRLTVVGEFEGDAKSSAAKGFRSISEERSVAVEKVAGDGPLQFDLKITHVRTEQNGPKEAPSVERKEEVIRYALSASGVFTPVKS